MSKSCLLLLTLFATQVALAQTGSFSGTVVDDKTGDPLVGATVVLEGTDLGTVADIQGSYRFENIPVKTYNITASYLGYASLTKYNIVIRSEGNVDINFRLEEQAASLGEVVVTASPFGKLDETPLSIQRLSQEEVASYPGGNNDIAKVVQSLPGVSGSVGGFRNDVIIRGGAPNENVYYLDGVEIPNINHFSTQGSAGGPVGLLNVSFIEGVTLTTSAFGAQYDNVLSGAIQFDQRKGNARKFTGNFRLGASESALTLEGPLFKGSKETSKTTVLASVRRSYLQFLFDAIGLPFLPDYWDYQYKVHHTLDDHNEIMITGVGSIDDFAVNDLEEYDPEQQAIQDQVPVIRQKSNVMGITWKRRFKNRPGFMQTTISNNVLMNEFLRYEDNINQTGLYFINDSREQETKLRYHVTTFPGIWTVTYGAVVQQAGYRNNTEDLVNDFSYRSSLSFFRYGLFTQASAKFYNNRLSASVGLRADGNSFTDTGHELYRTLSPRISFSYQLADESRWTINSSAGRYYKIPPYTILGFRDNNSLPVNRNTKYIQSDHLVAGVEYATGKASRITVEGFVKWYDDYPVSITDSVSLANKGGGFEVFGNEPVSSSGKGRTYGVELLYQKKFDGKFYAIVALTLYRSEFTGFDRSQFISSTWDNGQLLSILGGYKLPRNWEVSMRYRFLGKTPYAPVDQDATLQNYPAVIQDYDRLGEVQLNPFSQLDFRVDKKWSFKKFSLDVFVDIQNVLKQDLPSAPSYGLDRDDSGNIIMPRSLVQVNANDEGQVVPSLGLVINF